MDNFIEVLNYITYIATEEQMVRIKKACSERQLTSAPEPRKFLQRKDFTPGDRVMIVGNVRPKYRGMTGTVNGIKVKNINVELDAVGNAQSMLMACPPQFLKIITTSPKVDQTQEKTIKKAYLDLKDVRIGEQVRIADIGRGKWSGLHGQVENIGSKNVTVMTAIGVVRVNPRYLEKVSFNPTIVTQNI